MLYAVSPAWAREIGPGDDLRAAVAGLKPGDELVLRGGRFVIGSRFLVTAQGTPSAPIVLRAKSGERPVIEQTDRENDIIEIRDSRHFTVRGIAFRGGSHGIDLARSDFVTIEDCEIYDTGDAGIAANSGGTYEGLRLLRNNIHDTGGHGEGMYLGCNHNACRVANSLIEGNHIHHTNGPSVTQGDGIELKEGSYGNIIRDNVIHDTKSPGIITYGTAGNGAANIVERNVIWNASDNGIQSAADAVIRNNIVLGSPIALQKHQAASPANLEVVHNTVITKGDAIAVRDVSGRVLIANNAVYSQDGDAIGLVSGTLSLVTVRGNVGVGDVLGVTSGFETGQGLRADFVNAHFGGMPPIDPRPKPGSALIAAGSPVHVTIDDFNGTPRKGVSDAGAYGFGRPGTARWVIGPTFKVIRGDTRN